MRSLIARSLRPIVALAAIGGLYWGARLPAIAHSERLDLSRAFRFQRSTLPAMPGAHDRSQRLVNPAYEPLVGWISTVGAAVALNDLDGDGLPNDLCHVDPRTDDVLVTPVPGTAPRYAMFALTPPDPYDPATMAPMGCVPADLNEDGVSDLLVYYWGRSPVAYLQRPNVSPSASAFVAREIVPAEPWYTNAATTADLDGDGHLDLVFGNYFPEDAGVLAAAPGTHPRMHDSMSRALNGGVNRILRWTAPRAGVELDVQYDIAPDAIPDSVARGWCLAVGAADLDGDLLPELYFGHDFGPDRLLHNRSTPGHIRFAAVEGRKTLTTPASKVLGHDSFKGMGVDFGDLNGDGRMDIYVSNIAAEYALEESHFAWVSHGDPADLARGIAPYRDLSESLGLSRSGWGWESRLADFNNDGVLEAIQATGFLKGHVNRWPELHETAMGNDRLIHHATHWHRYGAGDDLSGHDPNPFFVRAADGRFYDLSAAIGLDDPQVSRGIATADVDGDGDLDFAVANQWEDSAYYENQAPTPGDFLGLRLRRNGTIAIGATARVTLPDGRVLVAQVDGGNGHSGVRSPDLHFGLGRLRAATVTVELAWRDAGGLHHATHRLRPGWHTLALDETDGRP